MTLKELKEWIKSAHYDGMSYDEYDQNGNSDQTRIFEKDGKFYSVDYCNGEPCEVLGDHGFIRGEYEPKEVTRHTEMIERVYYWPVKKSQDKGNKNENSEV